MPGQHDYGNFKTQRDNSSDISSVKHTKIGNQKLSPFRGGGGDDGDQKIKAKKYAALKKKSGVSASKYSSKQLNKSANNINTSYNSGKSGAAKNLNKSQLC
jgi:hypothetical protein